MKQRERDLGGRQALPDVAEQEIDHRRTAQGAGQLLTEGGDPAEQREIVERVRGVGRDWWKEGSS